jgi:tetratricopeptide (TPR) repeat protein
MGPGHKSIFKQTHGPAVVLVLAQLLTQALPLAAQDAQAPAQKGSQSPQSAGDPTLQNASDTAVQNVTEAPIQKMILKPGKSLSVGMMAEDIICTNDVSLASKQRDSYPDSPEASFIYAVALSRTSRVEDALKEVRRARRLAEKQGGPAYFDKMIDTYEKMLTYYPDDNQVRYHLAWAYYMKAYVLAKYSHLANTPQAKYKEWVAQASKADEPKNKGTDTTSTGTNTDTGKAPEASAAAAVSTDLPAAAEKENTTDVLANIQKASGTISKASPQAIPQVQKYYKLAMGKLDDVLVRDPGDTWSRVYRAFLQAEYSGDLDTAMSEWQKVIAQQPANPAAYFFLGQGYLKQGNLKECLSNVSKAVALRAIGN